jgi:serine/threonine protein kinase
LRGFESIGGGWYFVVMDMLSGYQTLQDYQGSELKPSVVEAIHESLRLFHQAGYVHCDIRNTNIMVSESGNHLMIVDLDWGGNAGVARYPGCVNFEEIERPLDARDGRLITKEHDHFMINTIQVLRNTTVRCASPPLLHR